MIREKIYHLGVFLVEQLKLDQPGKGKPELEQDLLALVEDGNKSAVREYYVRKVLLVLAILAGGLVLTLISFLMYCQSGRSSTLEYVLRPGYGEDDRRTALSVQVDEEEEVRDLEVKVQARKLTDEQKQQMLDEAILELEECVLGQNESLDFVQTDLIFPEKLQNGQVFVDWSTEPYGIIDRDGKILEAEEESGTLVEIQAFLSCGGREAIYNFGAKVFPPDLSEEERLIAAIIQEVERADNENCYESELVLPDSVEGKRLTWVRGTENPAPGVLAVTLMLAVILYLELDSRVHDRAAQRKNQLLLDYPDLMWKMTMLLGAGMSLRSVFMRISDDYIRGQKDTRPRYVYDEVTRTCNEMRSGVGEAQAYERFGRRCQLPAYVRIGSILSQNLKKGAKGLTALLESEAEASLNDRKAHAREIGEQAGTKMLLPMGLMLVIVLAVLMVPAFLSF